MVTWQLSQGAIVARRFEIVRDVARGGMGRVLEARDLVDGSPVALKVMLDVDARAGERFAREVELLADLRHPSIVRYVDHGVLDDGTPYLAMEWLEGQDLSRLLGETGASRATSVGLARSRSVDAKAGSRGLSVDEAIAIGARIAGALAELAARGIVHRDLKPHNVVLPAGDPRRATLIDFGTAKLRRTSTSLTRPGNIVGTPAHMAPEQATGDADVGPPADVFALGVLLFEMIAGRPPFEAEHVVALLAKIALAEAPDLREVKREVDPQLAELVASCLRKAPADRPTAAEIEERLDLMARTSSVLPVRSERPLAPAVGRAERRARAIVCVGAGLRDDDALEMKMIVSELRGDVKDLVDGTRVIRFERGEGRGTLTDHAVLAARSAIACRERWPELRFAVVSGRVDTDAPIGPLLDRAGELLERATIGSVVTDAETAALLETRFVVERRDVRTMELREERPMPAPARTLLGRASSWVGRDREIAFLDGMLDDCMHECRAGGAVVVGEPGMGKSRLRHEWLESTRARYPELRVFAAHADAVAAGAPFALLVDVVERAAGILPDDAREHRRRKLTTRLASVPTAERARTAAALAELLAIADADDELHVAAARRDPMRMGDAIRAATITWLEAEARLGPLVLVLEDLHWGDLPSVRTIDAALRVLDALPLLVLATARPEVRRVFPGLFAGRNVQDLALSSLGRRAAERLVREAIGDGAPPDMVDRLVARGQGNAFFLEELVRSVVTGTEALPDSVLAVVEARLEALGPVARQVLRAASVIGETFEPHAVAGLLEGDVDRDTVAAWLETLVDREVLTRPRDRGAHAISFRHALVRDAAYAMLVDRDRRVAHGRAAAYLESIGRADPLALATHRLASDEPVRAVPHLRDAARAALEGNDFDAVHRHADAALALGASGTVRGELEALLSSAAYWESRYDEARVHAALAREDLRPGSTTYFRALADEAVSSARLGDRDGLERAVLLSRTSAHDGSKEAFEARLVALCRAAFQVVFAGRFEQADELLGFVDGLVIDERMLLDETRAQWHHVRGVRAAHAGDVATFFRHLTSAVEAFDRAGDARNVALESPTLGWCWVEVSDLDRAEHVLRASIARCERLGAEQATTYALVNLGYALAIAGRDAQAFEVLADAIARCDQAQNPRLCGWALGHRAGLHLERGDLDSARDDVERAVATLSASPGLSAWALALRARVSLARDETATVLPDVDAAFAIYRRLGGLLQHESVVHLARLEAYARAERLDEARLAAVESLARLDERASRFDDPELRAGFLRTPAHQRLVATCRLFG